MKRHFLSMAVCMLVSVTAFGADDGNTKWRLNQVDLSSSGVTYDIIATTNGAGNIKGVHCDTDTTVTLKVYVNGGSAETIAVDPGLVDDGFIPFNIRFTSSIRVTGFRSTGSPYVTQNCAVSWGLD